MNLKKTLTMMAGVALSGVALSVSVFADIEYPEEYKDDPNKNNCVYFVRNSMGVENLRQGLGTWDGKKKLLSEPGDGHSSYGIDVCPEPGWVAVVDTRNSQPNGQKYGHIAYVEDANEEDGTITVVTLDGNWKNSRVYRRTGTPSELKIVGYWAP